MYRSHSTSHETVTVIPVAASYLSSGEIAWQFRAVREPASKTWLNRPRALRVAPFVKIDAAPGV